ncbi:tetratricopeptide repeat protein [Olivibacter sitiensis]|uniref:tetratricopeptide repeat protein n=1 Tax=Olivibacter sitiensis TaxID=376470 RepID=UPI0004132002|nr:tetratricopeptide repeat protein [Olivibacter sitiensis]
MKIARCLIVLVFLALVAPIASLAQETLPDSALSSSLLTSGISERNEGNVQQAVADLQRAVKVNPQNDQAYFELARLQLEMGSSGEAAINAKKAAQLNPDNEWYWILLSDVYKQMEDFASLPPIYAKLIALKPKQREFYFDKAYSEFLSKDYEAALKTYALIEKEFGSSDNLMLARHNVYIAQGQSHIAVEELNKLIKNKPKDNKGYILLSNLYLKLGDPKQAMAALDRAEKKIPKDPYIAISRSDVYNAQNEEGKALDNLKKVFMTSDLKVEDKVNILSRVMASRDLKREQWSSVEELANILTTKYPEEAVVHAIYGDVLVQTGKQDLARMQYIRSTQLDAHQNKVWEQLLQLDLTNNHLKDAAVHADTAVNLFPDSPITQFFAGHAFSFNKEFDKARSSFEAALNHADERNEPFMAQIYGSLGDTYNALHMYRESDLAYNESLALEPDNVGVLNNYAYYLSLRKENLDQAAQMSSRANMLEPNNATFEDTYAWVLFQQGKYQEALVWIEKAIGNSDSSSVALLEHYGDILAKLGKEKEAMKQWESALKIAGDDTASAQTLKKKIDLQAYVE